MDLEGLRWEGYLRQDGALGIRNKVLVVYTVECAQFVAEEIARRRWIPTFICKSAGTQAEDALEMKKIYQVFCGN